MQYTTVKFPYCDSYQSALIPSRNIAYILSPKYAPGIADEQAALREALRNPIGKPALRECVGKSDRVAVIVTDNTRHCPDDRLLPVILAELEQKVPAANITIIVALGLHAPLSKDQLIKKLGERIAKNYQVINHDPDDTITLGTTSRGTPVQVNRKVVEADFRISTGFIEPHFFAGFSGGRKSIAPGVSGAQAIRHNHSFEMLEHPLARAGVLHGNPVHEDLVEQAKMAKLDFILNVLLNRDCQITHVVAGDPFIAHEQGCEIERDLAQVEVELKVDIAITSNGGAPLDLDFYQTVKGIDTASQITRDGGVIIAVSSCHAGLGPDSFVQLHESADSAASVLHRLKTFPGEGVGWQNQILARAQRRHKIFLLSSLPDDQVRRMGVTPIRTIEEGVEQAMKLAGKDAKIGIIPEGPLVIPHISSNLKTQKSKIGD